MTDKTAPQLPILYHAPLACSLAVRIAAAMGQVPLKLVQVNLNTHRLDDGSDYRAINPLGQVSTLRLPDGSLLFENIACLSWLQDQSAIASFRRTPNNPEYIQTIRWMGFIATELHKQIYRIVFYDEADDAVKDNIRALAPDRLMVLDTHLKDRKWLLGENFSAADAYLVWVLLLADKAGLNITAHHNLCRYQSNALANAIIANVIADDRLLKSQER